MRILRPATRSFSSSGGGGKPPRRPFNALKKDHYIEHVDTKSFSKVLRNMQQQAESSDIKPFKCHQMRQDYVLYRHHLNKGGAESILMEGGLRASEASGIAGGAYAVRATGVADPNLEPIPDRDMLYFITDVEPSQTGNGGGMSGIGWPISFLPFRRAIMVRSKDGSMTEFTDIVGEK